MFKIVLGKALLSAFLSFFFSPGFSQFSIAGTIVDNESSRPLAYARIENMSDTSGDYTDSLGRYTISYKSDSDSIAVFAIGFFLEKTSVKQLKENKNLVKLTRNDYLVAETTVKPAKKWKKREIGYYHDKLYSSSGTKEGHQRAVLIKNKLKTPAIITSIKFRIRKVGDCHNLLRIRLMNAKPANYGFTDFVDTIPDHDLITDNLIVDPDDYKGKNCNININISKYGIQLPDDGIFVVFEGIERKPKCVNEYMKKYYSGFILSSPFIKCQQDPPEEALYKIAGITYNYWDIISLSPAVGLTVKVPEY